MTNCHQDYEWNKVHLSGDGATKTHCGRTGIPVIGQLKAGYEPREGWEFCSHCIRIHKEIRKCEKAAAVLGENSDKT